MNSPKEERSHRLEPTAAPDPALALASPFERWLSWIVPALILLALAIRVPFVVNAKLWHDEIEIAAAPDIQDD